MSSLQESVDARRAARPHDFACAVVGAQSPALIVHVWQGGSWVLPWSYLAGVSLKEENGIEVLELSFTGYIVQAYGHNLLSLLPDFANFRVTYLHDLPADYRTRLLPDAPFIHQLEVQASKETGETPG